ncbi:MAG: tetratricopeptide repeat protein, partial [Candidatus Doudnabacteria bacterium]|nr:tetratricopeptide repeat protein [Candidatus Doudnabacteria bacterium]
MFTFIPQLLIILSIVGIIVIVFGRATGLPNIFESKEAIGAKLKAEVRWVAKQLWHFVLEVKEISKNPHLRSFPKVLSRFHFPKASSLLFFGGRKALRVGKLEENFEEAERNFINVIKHDPHNEAAYAGLAKLYLSGRKYKEAVETYKFLIKRHPDNDGYYSHLGQAYHGTKKYVPAAEAHEQAIALAPRNPGYYLNLGQALEAQGHLEEAILNYRRAADLDGENTRYLMMLSEALVKKGE